MVGVWRKKEKTPHVAFEIGKRWRMGGELVEKIFVDSSIFFLYNMYTADAEFNFGGKCYG